ncbi:MAG: hypothetical protein GPOALKHO_001334 [Sodalis sp.]|nr:MAG: hypothetical protein GPOALKHO_001334 [Sodalis sp.]
MQLTDAPSPLPIIRPRASITLLLLSIIRMVLATIFALACYQDDKSSSLSSALIAQSLQHSHSSIPGIVQTHKVRDYW